VNVPNGLHTQAAAAPVLPARSEELGVETVKVLRGQALQRHCTDRWYHVVRNVATIRVESARAELSFLCWQPSFQQVPGDVDTVRRAVVAVVALFHQVCQQPLSVLARVAGGMPSAAGLAGARVQALVDDRVVPAALPGDMTPHFRPFSFSCRACRS